MADDKKVYDIDLDFSGATDDLLKDVKAATEAVKQKKANLKAAEVREAASSKSKKTSGIIIAVAAVAILLLSYWMVFAKQDAGLDTANSTNMTQAMPIQPTKIAVPTQTKAVPTTTPAAPPVSAVGRDSNSVVHPPDGYEQPTDDPGM